MMIDSRVPPPKSAFMLTPITFTSASAKFRVHLVYIRVHLVHIRVHLVHIRADLNSYSLTLIGVPKGLVRV
jgi:hypothetical protein